MIKYKDLLRGGIWRYMSCKTQTCKGKTHKLLADNCDFIVVIEDAEFKKRFKLIENG